MVCPQPYFHYFVSLYFYIGMEIDNQILFTKMKLSMLLILSYLSKIRET